MDRLDENDKCGFQNFFLSMLKMVIINEITMTVLCCIEEDVMGAA
jgi:hypothetical protein